MARHSDGKKNYSLSKGMIVALIVVLALIAVLVSWFFFRDSSPEEVVAEDECIQGDLVLPVAEASDGLAEGLINQWNDSTPTVRDHCVTAEIVDSVDNAAVLIALDNPGAADIIGERSVSSTVPIGVDVSQLWSMEDTDLSKVDPADVSYRVATDPDTAVAVATALAGDNAPKLIARDREVTKDSDAEISAVGPSAGIHKGLGNTENVPGAEVITMAHVFNQSGDITEEQTRAAAEFASFHDVSEEIPADLPDRSKAWAAVEVDESAEESSAEEAPPEEAPIPEVSPADTLILFDTSANTNAAFGQGSIHSVATTELASLATDLGASGKKVALWNYSSPLNPGVTNGWRRNLGFTEGDQAATAVERFGTGGVPQTRSAVVAAASTAADHARESGGETRVLLVTTGTAENMSAQAFTDAFNNAIGDAAVSIDVVHVGDSDTDSVLKDLAGSFTSVDSPEQLDATLRSVTGL